MSTIIRIRRDVLENWELANPVLEDGEVGFIQDVNGKTIDMKVGNAVDDFLTLPIFTPSSFNATEILNKLKTVDGVASGLDAEFLAGYGVTALPNALTIPVRDSAGDMTARLFRSTYAEQASAPSATADICFRNDTTDNYIRFMSKDALLSYLNVASGTRTVQQVVTVQTRGQASYSCPISGAGTNISALNLVITPKKAGNKVILDWTIQGEGHNDIVFVVLRNGSYLANTVDASNNRFSGTAVKNYDTNIDSTPEQTRIRIIDESSLGVATTYAVYVRSSGGATNTFIMNRAWSSAGQDNYETSLSTGVATEIGV